MLKNLSVVMAWVMFANSVYAAESPIFDAAGAGQAPASQTPTLQQQIIQIPIGSVIEVRLTNKEKLKGQLGAVSSEGIILKYAKAGHIEERKIAFSEVQSIKAVNGGKAKRTVLYVLAGIGVFVVVLFVIAAVRTGGFQDD